MLKINKKRIINHAPQVQLLKEIIGYEQLMIKSYKPIDKILQAFPHHARRRQSFLTNYYYKIALQATVMYE